MIHRNTPTIETQRLILRKFTESDDKSLLELLSDLNVNKFLPWFPLKTIDEAKKFLSERFLSYYGKPFSCRYALCLKEDNKPIGYIWLADNDSNDFGYALKKEFWHSGLITEAASAVVERIKNAGLQYITATHDTNNPRSGQVMKNLGMQYKYSYKEQWEPKNISVTFRMYQLNFDACATTYTKYLNEYPSFVEENL